MPLSARGPKGDSIKGDKGDKGDPGTPGAPNLLVLNANDAVPANTPTGTVILRRP